MANKKILLIDDNKDFRYTMGIFLERSGFDVASAEDGKTGWDHIQKDKPDLILLDVMMEDMYAGFEVCRKIRVNDEYKSIPIIGISAMADEIGVKFDKEEDKEYFCPNEFLDKPVDKEVLLEKINRLLS